MEDLGLGLRRDRRALETIVQQLSQAGTVPLSLEEAILILLRKEGRNPKSSSVYRSIYLFESSKMFKRILSGRIIEYLTRKGPNLSSNTDSAGSLDDQCDLLSEGLNCEIHE